MTDGTGTTMWGYNRADEVVSADGPWVSDVLNFTRDALGRRQNRIATGVTTTNSFDAAGRLATVGNTVLGTRLLATQTAFRPS